MTLSIGRANKKPNKPTLVINVLCKVGRPLEFCKESEEKIQSDNQILMDQINNIEPCVVNGRDLKVFMRISPTMWDGKSDSAIIKHT